MLPLNSKRSAAYNEQLSYIPRACAVYCEGPLLRAVQLAGIFNDSKTFVDMPMKQDPEVILAAFSQLSDPSDAQQLRVFVDTYFDSEGSDLEVWIPTDFNSNAKFLEYITDPNYKQWAAELNNLWSTLGRKTISAVVTNPERHSFLPRQWPMIVPGGRFRESYYWDSWWIVRGLLVCDMSESALYVIRNLIDDVRNFGFIPNGGRIYYLDRSQPPLLSEMIRSYFLYTVQSKLKGQQLVSSVKFHPSWMGDGTDALASAVKEDAELRCLLYEAYEVLRNEYDWWMNAANGHTVSLRSDSAMSSEGEGFVLNRYFSNATSPRPESYVEDYSTITDNISSSTTGAANIDSENKEDVFYQNIRAGAESGWDFSSRWIRDSRKQSKFSKEDVVPVNLADIRASEIVPVDLNSIMYRMEMNLATMADILHHVKKVATDACVNDIDRIKPELASDAEKYWHASLKRKEAMQTFLWDAGRSQWKDLNLTSYDISYDGMTVNPSKIDLFSDEYTSIANWIPLWAGIPPPGARDRNYPVASLEASGLVQPGGVLTTNLITEQQWDSPNAWPPLVMFTIEGLNSEQSESSVALAKSLTDRWLRSCYIAFNSTGYMYEKYNAYEVGVGGGGGEYIPQVGFGWSNAVALILLQQLYPACAKALASSGVGSGAVLAAASEGSIDEITYETLLYIVIAVVMSVALTFIIGICIVYYLYHYTNLRGAAVRNTEMVLSTDENYRLMSSDGDDEEDRRMGQHHIVGSFTEQDEPAIMERVMRNSSFSRAAVGLDPFDEELRNRYEVSKDR